MPPTDLKNTLSSLETFDKQSKDEFSKTKTHLETWMERHKFLEELKDQPTQDQGDSGDGREDRFNTWKGILSGSYDMKQEIKDMIDQLTANYEPRFQGAISIFEDYMDEVPFFRLCNTL
jgi:hypothetical protein